MRTNFFYKFKSADEDDLHSISIQDMGNYHEYLKNQAQPLRELETQLVRQHMFGNPFKLVSKDQKTSMFGADEIDEVFEESAENQQQKTQSTSQPAPVKRAGSAVGGPATKRRGASKGPLSKRINYLKNLYTSNTSSASSTVSDSDIELLDETSSTVSGFSTTSFGSGDSAVVNEKLIQSQQLQPQQSDIANLNDFLDVEMPSIETSDEFKQANNIQQPIQQARPASASSNSSSTSSSSNEAIELNPIIGSTSLCDNYLEQSYVQLKIMCIEQVKKPGKDHSQLFQLLQNSQLTIRMRQFLIKELIHEAHRFKRTQLVDLMNKYSNLLTQLNVTSVTPNSE